MKNELVLFFYLLSVRVCVKVYKINDSEAQLLIILKRKGIQDQFQFLTLDICSTIMIYLFYIS